MDVGERGQHRRCQEPAARSGRVQRAHGGLERRLGGAVRPGKAEVQGVAARPAKSRHLARPGPGPFLTSHQVNHRDGRLVRPPPRERGVGQVPSVRGQREPRGPRCDRLRQADRDQRCRVTRRRQPELVEPRPAGQVAVIRGEQEGPVIRRAHDLLEASSARRADLAEGGAGHPVGHVGMQAVVLPPAWQPDHKRPCLRAGAGWQLPPGGQPAQRRCSCLRRRQPRQ